MSYYQNVFGDDSAKLSKMKQLIVEDFKKAELGFFEADKSKDILKMNAHLHRIYPIVSNLKFSKFLALIDAYKTHDNYGSELSSLNDLLREYFDEVYLFLRTK